MPAYATTVMELILLNIVPTQSANTFSEIK